MNKAFQIAHDNLRTCQKMDGIAASIDCFDDFWARDAFYASWGLIETEEFEKVRSNLELFIKYQKKDGQIPRRIDRFFAILNYLRIKIRRKYLKPIYRGAYVYRALDPNILFVVTCYKYIKKSNDLDFLRKNFDAISRAVEWLKRYEKEKLLQEGIFANWMDVIIKTGAVLYSNVLYAEALNNFSEICGLLDKTDMAADYLKKHQSLKEKINKEFWNGGYYIDWISKNKKYDYLATDGNVLAMLFGISNQEQNKKIISHIEDFGLDKIPLKTNYPSYPWWRAALRLYIVGIPGYQNNFASWLWLGCCYAVALDKNGFKEKAEIIYQKVSSKIEEYGGVYEMYTPDGAPYMGWFWKGAASFAWSAGLYLWMSKILNK